MAAPTLPAKYAAERDWIVPDALEIKRYSALSANWAFTKEIIGQIQAVLGAAKLPDTLLTLAVAGSLGRMDAAKDVSDCDLLVVLSDAGLKDEARAKATYDDVWAVLKRLDLNPPKPTGTFSKPTSIEQLCDKKNIGAADEDMRSFAKRLLLLLETQPVYKPDGYQKVVDAVVKSYAEEYVAKDPRKEWGFLINDLIRYFRSLCVNYQWDFENEHGKWPLGESITRDPGMIELRGPVFHPPDLTWLQIEPATAGFRELGRMHRAADTVLRPYIVRDEVSPLHAGDSYCPHVTLGWSSSEADVLALFTPPAPVAIVARLVSLVLVKYPEEWPVKEDLKIVYVAYLSVQSL